MDRPTDPTSREPPSGPAAAPTVARYEAELAAACDAARLAGAAISSAFGGQQAVRYKTGDDPLTVADETADRLIHDRLRAAFPSDAWLSEEGDGRAAAGGRLWVVDPLDGTREFVDGIPEFAVSIALVVDGRPVVAVVYQPIVGLLVCATAGRGVTADDLPVTATRQRRLPEAVVLASRSEVGRGHWRPLDGAFHIKPTGSIAWKLALVACGRADATISLAPQARLGRRRRRAARRRGRWPRRPARWIAALASTAGRTDRWADREQRAALRRPRVARRSPADDDHRGSVQGVGGSTGLTSWVGIGPGIHNSGARRLHRGVFAILERGSL